MRKFWNRSLVCQAADGILGFQHDGLCVEDGGLLTQILFMYHGLVDKAVEPAVGGDKVAVMRAVGAPAVLNFPAVWFSVLANIHAGQAHSVVHAALAAVQRR